MLVRALLPTCIAQLTRTASYRAFIKKNGTHRTRAVGLRCWNTELIENVNLVLALAWTGLDEHIATGFSRRLAEIKKSVSKITASATSSCPPVLKMQLGFIDTNNLGSMAPRGFIDQLRAREQHLLFSLENESSRFKRDLGYVT